MDANVLPPAIATHCTPGPNQQGHTSLHRPQAPSTVAGLQRLPPSRSKASNRHRPFAWTKLYADWEVVSLGDPGIVQQGRSARENQPRAPLLGLQDEPVGGVFFDCRTAEDERSILALGPHGQ